MEKITGVFEKKKGLLYLLLFAIASVLVYSSGCGISIVKKELAKPENRMISSSLSDVLNDEVIIPYEPLISGSPECKSLVTAILTNAYDINIKDAANGAYFISEKDAWDAFMSKQSNILFTSKPSSYIQNKIDKSAIQINYKPVCYNSVIILAGGSIPYDDIHAETVKQLYENVNNTTPVLLSWNDTCSNYRLFSLTVMDSTISSNIPSWKKINDISSLVALMNLKSFNGQTLGYCSYNYIGNIRLEKNIKILSVNGIFPDETSIKSGTYPFSTVQYVAIREGESETSQAGKLWNWIFSKEGAVALRKSGFIPFENE